MHEPFAIVSQINSTGSPTKDFGSQPRFDFPNLGGQGRLRNPALSRGSDKASAIGDGDHIFKISKIDGR
jgi:hypothetical protein